MVIQRWQSVLLLFAAVAMGIFSFSEISQIIVSDSVYNQSVMGITDESNPVHSISTYYFFALSLLTSLLSVLSIFLFKNLSLQKKICKVNMLLYVVAYVVAGIIAYTSFAGEEVSWNYTIAYPIIAFVFTLFAHRQIVKDENKLRSYDRIR